MNRVETNRAQMKHLYNCRPFQNFAINLENGDRVVVEHPENLAFDPNDGGRDGFILLTAQIRYYSTFSSITSLAVLDDAKIAA